MFTEKLLADMAGPITMLALVALLGYLVGRVRHTAAHRKKDRHEIGRALAVSQELEAIAFRLQRSLSNHIPAVERFNARLTKLENKSGVSWYELCDRADELLKPVMQLGTEISHAYAELLQQMASLATFAELRTDPLTGVANRRAFDESLASLLAQHNRYGVPLSLAMLDIDLFKEVNDRMGHLHGDRVLQELAALLKASVRDCDIVARFGGEEFVVLLPYTELHGACQLVERIRADVEAKLPATVSIGLAAATEGDAPNDLLARADQALYAAKHAGRNCVHIHEGASGRIVAIKVMAVSVADEVSVDSLASPPALHAAG